VYCNEIKLYPSKDDPRRLVFITPSGCPAAPPEYRALRQEFLKLARVTALLFERDAATRVKLFLLMHEAAYRGLCDDDFSLEDGKGNLVDVQVAVTDEAHAIRSQRLSEYTGILLKWGLPAFAGGVLAMLVTHLFGWGAPFGSGSYSPILIWIVAAFWIPAGAIACVWGEFALRMQSGLTYDTLLAMDPSRWLPNQRTLVCVGVAYIFAFLLAFDVLRIGMGNVLLNDFASTKPAVSLAVGGITGLAFAAIRDAIFRAAPEERKSGS
jgi:hypothetical protein